MELIIMVFAIILLLVPIIIFEVVLPATKSTKRSNGIVNCDTFMTVFLFKVDCKKEEFLQGLRITNAYDTMEYCFDKNEMKITFSKQNSSVSYAITVKESDNATYIRLNRVGWLLEKNYTPYYINEFMIKKFNAELLPYHVYRATV